jgi:CheY-like chemotaxis protein
MLEKVLLIDDDEISLLLCEMVLEQTAFAKQVIKLSDGKQGIDFYERQAQNLDATEAVPELIFLDLNMPIMNGWDFLEEFSAKYQAQFPKTRVAILSSSIDPHDVAKSKEYSFVIDFLNKPLTDADVLRLSKNEELLESLCSK